MKTDRTIYNDLDEIKRMCVDERTDGDMDNQMDGEPFDDLRRG